MEHNNGGLVQMIFLLKGVIFRFHVCFRGCNFQVPGLVSTPPLFKHAVGVHDVVANGIQWQGSTQRGTVELHVNRHSLFECKTVSLSLLRGEPMRGCTLW